MTRRQLARFTAEAGDPAGARDLFAALVPAMERVYGADHQLHPYGPPAAGGLHRQGGQPGRGTRGLYSRLT
jgi:hypothetical protein